MTFCVGLISEVSGMHMGRVRPDSPVYSVSTHSQSHTTHTHAIRTHKRCTRKSSKLCAKSVRKKGVAYISGRKPSLDRWPASSEGRDLGRLSGCRWGGKRTHTKQL